MLMFFYEMRNILIENKPNQISLGWKSLFTI